MSNGLMGDYCDGLLFSDNKLFNEDPAALQIQLYYDELEVCNPLGSKTKKHKLGMCLTITSESLKKTNVSAQFTKSNRDMQRLEVEMQTGSYSLEFSLAMVGVLSG